LSGPSNFLKVTTKNITQCTNHANHKATGTNNNATNILNIRKLLIKRLHANIVQIVMIIIAGMIQQMQLILAKLKYYYNNALKN
jgi:hypothetical protein